MTTKRHEPKPWDLYRTPGGNYAIVNHAGQIGMIVTAAGEMCDRDMAVQDEDEFLGNILALPGLVEACQFAKAHIRAGAPKKALPFIRKSLRDAGLLEPEKGETKPCGTD